MTKGELEKVALALYKITKVEGKINDVTVWDSLGPNGIESVDDLNDAISELTHVIYSHAVHSIELRSKVSGRYNKPE